MVGSYVVHVLNRDGKLSRVYELGPCKNEAEAIEICHGLMARHDHLQLWKGSELIHAAKRSRGARAKLVRFN